MDDIQEVIGRQHQELQALAFFFKKGLSFEYDSKLIIELEKAGLSYRPDFLFRGKVTVIVEIDEDYHDNYIPDNEIARMLSIWKAFDGNISFIRVGVKRSQVLTHTILKKVYDNLRLHMIDLTTRSKLVVNYIEYPEAEIYKYKAYERDIDILTNSDKVKDIKLDDVTTTVIINNKDSCKCKRCGHVSQTKYNLKVHLQRKIPCVPISDNHDIDPNDLLKTIPAPKEKVIKCTSCNRAYVSKSSLKRHIAKDHKVKSNITNDILANEIKKLQDQVNAMSLNFNKASSN